MKNVNKNDNFDKSIEELVKKAQSGDLHAFGKIYDYYSQRIYRYVFFRMDKSQALDLTETVFLKVWDNLKSYRKKNRGSFNAWIFRIAHNLIVDSYRNSKITEEIPDTMPDIRKDIDPKAVVESSFHRDRVRGALQRLKKPYQDVLSHFFINDLNNSEVSKVMKKSEGAVRILKLRALKELKNQLGEYEMDNW